MQVVMARPVEKYVQSVEIACVHTWSAHQRSSSGISIGWMDALLSVCCRKMDGSFLHVRAKCLDAFAGARWLGALP